MAPGSTTLVMQSSCLVMRGQPSGFGDGIEIGWSPDGSWWWQHISRLSVRHLLITLISVHRHNKQIQLLYYRSILISDTLTRPTWKATRQPKSSTESSDNIELTAECRHTDVILTSPPPLDISSRHCYQYYVGAFLAMIHHINWCFTYLLSPTCHKKASIIISRSALLHISAIQHSMQWLNGKGSPILERNVGAGVDSLGSSQPSSNGHRPGSRLPLFSSNSQPSGNGHRPTSRLSVLSSMPVVTFQLQSCTVCSQACTNWRCLMMRQCNMKNLPNIFMQHCPRWD